ERFRPVARKAREHGISVRGYISCVLGCPYEGEVPAACVVDVAAQLTALGCYEISLGDTIGVGTPGKARELVRAVAGAMPREQIAAHFHDTYGQALANIYGCLEEGIATIDSSAGGLGGCPYAKGASGNVATEDVVYMLNGLGIEAGVDLERLLDAVELISRIIGRPPSSRVARAKRG
ncbi:MAG TPA: hydroxymethylglutaryl-CoA lyase, partial [Alphaproteobacteria bacterium]|nr:hydroxymethylglutaryl-CoA lyase [Alphaproteobacteria bacterium]